MNQSNKHPSSKAAKAAIVGLAALCAIAPARSQDGAKDDDIHYLDTYVTVANRFEMPLDRVGSSVHVIGSAELQDDQQPFLRDALLTVPGINLRNNGSPGAVFGMTVRGLNANRPTVLIDGIEVSNPASGEIINFGHLFASSVSRVEILKGAQSSLYGADAIAGVINIVTRGASPQPRGTIDVGYGSHETYQAHASFSGSANALGYAFHASHFDSQGFSAQEPSLGEAWADDDGYENTSFVGKLNYHASESTELYFTGQYTDSFSEYDPGNPDFIFGDPYPDSYTQHDRVFATMGARSALMDRWTSDLSLGYSEVDSLSKFNAGPPAENNGERIKLDWRNTVEAADTWNVVFGAEHETQKDTLADAERDDKAIYLENVISPSEALDWTIGARHDDNEDYGSETTYRATLSYLIAELNTRFHGSYGTSFQAPTFFQLSATNGFGNPELGPETGDGWDFGFDKTFADGAAILSATVFGYDIDEKIVWDPSLVSESRPWGTYANREQYQSMGIETAARWRPAEAARIKLAHTYVDAEYNNGAEAERVPRNTYSLDANWKTLDSKLNLNATVVYTGSQYDLQGATSKLPGYTVVNLAGSYRIAESYRLWARIDNLFDEEYQEVATYRAPGLSAYAGLRWEY